MDLIKNIRHLVILGILVVGELCGINSLDIGSQFQLLMSQQLAALVPIFLYVASDIIDYCINAFDCRASVSKHKLDIRFVIAAAVATILLSTFFYFLLRQVSANYLLLATSLVLCVMILLFLLLCFLAIRQGHGYSSD